MNQQQPKRQVANRGRGRGQVREIMEPPEPVIVPPVHLEEEYVLNQPLIQEEELPPIHPDPGQPLQVVAQQSNY